MKIAIVGPCTIRPSARKPPPSALPTAPGARYWLEMPGARWTIVIPFYNEEAWLPATLESLSAQTLRPFRIVLVDNASTDSTAARVRDWAARQHAIDVTLLHQPIPGQVHALEMGIAAVSTEFIAICDADTIYPPAYLETATRRLDSAPATTIGYIAHDTGPNPHSVFERAGRFLYTHIIPHMLPAQAHGGGYAHLFRTAPYKASGGYSARLWPYVLKDHELVNRLRKQGTIRYAQDLWMQPSPRRADRKGVRWTLFERILYHATLPGQKDWFFYRYLQPRFSARGQKDTVLRQQNWNAPADPN